MELPEDCWEIVFHFMNDESQWHAVSLTCKRFLSISNRARRSISVQSIRPKGELLKIFKRFPGLKHVDLSKYNGSLEQPLWAMEQVGLQIESLDLNGHKWLPLEAIRKLGRACPRLAVLNCSKFENWSDPCLQVIADSFTYLEELNLSHPQHGFRSLFPADLLNCPVILTDAGIHAMATALRYLRALNISGQHRLTDFAMQSLASSCPSLTELTLFDCPLITDEGLGYIACYCIKLSKLSAGGPTITQNGIIHAICSSLASLTLTHMILDDDLLAYLGESQVPLKKLELARCKGITSAGLLSLAKCCPSLVHLDLEGAQCLRDGDISELSMIIPELSYLHLNYCMLTDITFFGALCSFKHLKQLDMESTGLGWMIPSSFTLLQPCLNIVKLKLAWNKAINDSTLEAIGKLCSNLVYLDVSHCKLVTESGLEHIGHGCCQLKELLLKGCKKVKGLGPFDYFKSLEYVNFEASGITDWGLKEVGAGCKHLKFLGLAGCLKVTDQGLKWVFEQCKEIKLANLVECKGITLDAVQWMLFCNFSLRKLLLSTSSITEVEKARLTRHGCEIILVKCWKQ